MNRTDHITLMSGKRIRRTVKRIAHEINELNTGDSAILLFGINQRGYIFALALQTIISDLLENSVTVRRLVVDDSEPPEIISSAAELTPADSLVIIVDDVIFSGRTMFKALSIVISSLHPAEVHTAALIDRGHRKIPVQAEFCGMKLPTKLDEHVSVLTEKERLKEVVLTHR